MIDEKKVKRLVDKLRNDRARYICDGEFSPMRVTAHCAEAADLIELLLRELEQQQRRIETELVKNVSLEEEIEFIHEFISRNGLQYALLAERLNKT